MSWEIGVVIQPSALRQIHLKFFSLPAAPTRVRGPPAWTVLGQAQLGPKSTNRPWYSASSRLHSSRMASRYSRSMVRRSEGGTLWSAISSRFQPYPTPSTVRPPERWSTEAMVLARVIGSLSTGIATAVPRRIVEVTEDTAASATHGSSVRL